MVNKDIHYRFYCCVWPNLAKK